MPLHDWTRVDAGTFHDFCLSWIAEVRKVLNRGMLPAGFYAQAEQVAGNVGPDMLTLQSGEAEEAKYLSKQCYLAIRHKSRDQIIALFEIVSPGNKGSSETLRSFVAKAIAALQQGFHLLLVDLFPPTRRDPQGIHGAIWKELGERDYSQPFDKPLTVAGYSAERPLSAYVEPLAVGDTLPDMPLFLGADRYVSVPLETTYLEAWSGMPHRWRDVLEE